MANILGIKLSELSAPEALQKIEEFLQADKPHYVVTPNPEIILSAHEDEEFFYILNKADLSLADGFGLKIAAKVFGAKIQRITGADTTFALLGYATRNNIKTAVINWENGLSTKEEISQSIVKKFPGLNAMIFNAPRKEELDSNLIEDLNNFSPKLLFCGLGFPFQEKVIYHNLKKLPSVRVALGIGGTFDFLTGKARRAPSIWRRFGLEWLWRLIIQPNRYRRIFRATFVFLIKVIRARYINRLLYRPNVACWLYRSTPAGKEILVVEREDSPGHWQLPQGGTDGEDIETAGKRELREEVNATSIETKGVFKNVHRYDFTGSLKKQAYLENREYEAKKYKFDFKGQLQNLYIARFIGDESEIQIKFWDHVAWRFVPIEKLLETIHPVRQEGAKKFLDKFLSLNL